MPADTPRVSRALVERVRTADIDCWHDGDLEVLCALADAVLDAEEDATFHDTTLLADTALQHGEEDGYYDAEMVARVRVKMQAFRRIVALLDSEDG